MRSLTVTLILFVLLITIQSTMAQGEYITDNQSGVGLQLGVAGSGHNSSMAVAGIGFAQKTNTDFGFYFGKAEQDGTVFGMYITKYALKEKTTNSHPVSLALHLQPSFTSGNGGGETDLLAGLRLLKNIKLNESIIFQPEVSAGAALNTSDVNGYMGTRVSVFTSQPSVSVGLYVGGNHINSDYSANSSWTVEAGIALVFIQKKKTNNAEW